MKIGSDICAVLLVPFMLVLAGCASPADCCGDPESSGEAAVPASDAERLAMVLVDADQAFARGDKDRLTDALRRFDALGGQSLDENAADLQQWRQAVTQTPPMRGRTLGPGYRSGQLSAGSSESMEQVFLSGKRASVAVSAPGMAKLTLEVQGRRDEAVCGKHGNPSHCQWVPVFTDRYRIRIANPGKTAVRYYLVVE
jgi:hypothetical protein